ncbi:MAG: IS1634 family transposase [Syntrophaceae bacterium]|nr:IS1634 family transposase [Syntrophaceae bacterium]
MSFIRKVKTKSGATAVQIAYKQKGKIAKIIHIGSAHTEEELRILLDLAHKHLNENQLELFPEPLSSLRVEIKSSFSTLLFETLKQQYDKLGFTKLEDEIFELLCIARIVEPTSKLDSVRVLVDLGIGHIDRNKLYRCLAKASTRNYRQQISQACFDHAKEHGLTLLLYDVTTLFFQIVEGDDYRKPGLSKERRLEPQIILGLLVDKNGFPLGLHSFEGNKAETKTLLPFIEAFQAQHKLSKVTIVADAAMLSASNLEALTNAGYTYIVGSRLHKVPYAIAEYQKSGELSDQQIVTMKQDDYRVIYQYRAKRAALDLRNIEKQVSKAMKAINGQIPASRMKFVSVSPKSKQLNQKLIDKARALVGIKGYVTNLDIPDEEVIAYYHQLFQIEATFRMAKSDLRARPIYHRKRDSIEAHLTIVLAALAISKRIEHQTGISIKQFVKMLRPIRSGIVTINGKEVLADPDVPETVKILLIRLSSGH